MVDDGANRDPMRGTCPSCYQAPLRDTGHGPWFDGKWVKTLRECGHCLRRFTVSMLASQWPEPLRVSPRKPK